MELGAFCPNCFGSGFFGRCEACGYLVPVQSEGLYLSPGVLLQGRYLVGRVLGAGGFGVTYLVRDQQSGQRRALKEYFPAMLAVRDPASRGVRPSSSDSAELFTHGLSVFKREVQTLQSFVGNSAIVTVYDYFEAGGTAYFVMEYLDGVNLRVLQGSMGGKIPVTVANGLFFSIADTLSQVHKRGLIHRDVSPENIFVTKVGKGKLIDFGATRFFVGERSQSLSVVLKPGFAPPEQYSSRGVQGPWTDLYAFCATYYLALSAQAPPDAPERLSGKALPALYSLCPEAGHALCDAIHAGLSTDYRQRPQTMEHFLSMAQGVSTTPPPPAVSPPQAAAPLPQSPPPAPTPVGIGGTPYLQSVVDGAPRDRWLLPKNINMTIGRSAGQCNIVLDTPNVSRIHCVLRYDDHDGLFYLTDRSKNGTLTESGRIQQGRPVALRPESLFYIIDRHHCMKVGLE